MTPKFNSLILEQKEKAIKSEIASAAENDMGLIQQDQVDEGDVQDVKGLYAHIKKIEAEAKKMQSALAESKKVQDKMQGAISAGQKVAKREDKIRRGSGLGKTIKGGSYLGGAAGAGISLNAINDIYNNLKVSIQEFQQYVNSISDFMNSNLVEKSKEAAGGAIQWLKKTLDGGAAEPQQGTQSPTIPDIPTEEIMQNVDTAQFGLYVLAISVAAYFVGKMVQWVEGQYHKTRLKGDRKSYFKKD